VLAHATVSNRDVPSRRSTETLPAFLSACHEEKCHCLLRGEAGSAAAFFSRQKASGRGHTSNDEGQIHYEIHSRAEPLLAARVLVQRQQELFPPELGEGTAVTAARAEQRPQ
jgi:hypothetical protein